MKKLMVLAAVMMAAVAANATFVNWTVNAMNKSGSSTELLKGYTAYVIDQGSISQQAVLTALLAGNSLATTLEGKTYATGTLSTDTATISNLSVFDGTFDASAKVKFYTLVQDGDNVWFSSASTKTINGTGATTYSALTSSSKNPALTTTTFSSAGWYSTVPEPTSGLLLLLGMAGHALKSKRA